MVPFWFLPYAVAAGTRSSSSRPNERADDAADRGLLHDTGLPAGVINLVHGDRAVVEALIDHPQVKGFSVVARAGRGARWRNAACGRGSGSRRWAARRTTWW
jgi:acyl-CoA reductase-like NAD-dependent aldehyde dehydrogenase